MEATFDTFTRSFSTNLEPRVQKHLRNVYTCVAMSLLSAAAGVYTCAYLHILKGSFLITLAGLGFTVALCMKPNEKKNQTTRLGFMLAAAACIGHGTGPLLEMAIAVNPTIVMTALIGSSVLFVSFSLSAMFAKRGSMLYLGGILMTALSTMLIMSLGMIFFGSRMMFEAYIYLGLLVFSGFIVYDTQLIMEKARMGDDDFIQHALTLFIDFINVFRHLVVLLTMKEEKNKKRR